MPTLLISGAGLGINGALAETGGYQGERAWTNGSGVSLFYDPNLIYWVIADVIDFDTPNKYYYATILPGSPPPSTGWIAFYPADEPAPTVAFLSTVEPGAPSLTPQTEHSAQGAAVVWNETWTALYFRYLEKSNWANAPYRAIAPRIPIPNGENWEIQGLVTNVIYTGQFIATGADGVEVEGDAADFMATPANRVLLHMVPQIPGNERVGNGGPCNGIRYVIEGAGTAAGFSAIAPPAGTNGNGFLLIGTNSKDDLLGVNHVYLPEPDGDYCVHVILRDADGITERGGGQFIFKPQGMAPTVGSTFEPLFSAEDSGLISGGERVFYDSHFFVGGVVDGVKFFWKHNPQPPGHSD